MRRFDIVGISLVAVSAVVWTASRVFGSDVVPAKIVVQSVPTAPPALPRLVIPSVRFALGAGASENGSAPALAAGTAATGGNVGGSAGVPNVVGTSYFSDNPDASWALVSDGSGIRKIMKGAQIGNTVVTAVGDGVLYLADGRQLRPGSQSPQVPSIGNAVVPVDVAIPSPTPAAVVPAVPYLSAPMGSATPFGGLPTSAPPQVLNPLSLPTPQSMTPTVYPSP